MAIGSTFEFLGAIRRSQVYREIWRLFKKELLKCDFEHGNLFDMFLIKLYRLANHDKIIVHTYLVIFEHQQNI